MRGPGIRRLHSLERYLNRARVIVWIGVAVVVAALLAIAVLGR